MENDVKMRLCGGAFLTLLSNAKVKEITLKNGQKKHLSEREMFRRLISIYHLSEYEPKDKNNFKSHTSKYKNCKESLPHVIDVKNTTLKNNFDNDIKKANSLALQMMKDFVDRCITPGSEKYLISSLLDLIAQDNSIGSSYSFYISADGNPTTKKDLLPMTSFCFAPFLLGIWHCIIMSKSDNNRSPERYNAWVEELKQNGGKATREINIIPMPEAPPQPKESNSHLVAGGTQASTEEHTQILLQSMPRSILQPDTHYNIFALCSSCSKDGLVSLHANVNRLTQNDDQAIKDAFVLHTAEMKGQIKNLPCLFSFQGDFDEVGVPYDDLDFLPNEDNTFAFGYLEEIGIAMGKEDIVITIRPRIEQLIPQIKLIDNLSRIYSYIGVRYPSVFYSEGLTIVQGDLLAGLNKLGIQI